MYTFLMFVVFVVPVLGLQLAVAAFAALAAMKWLEGCGVSRDVAALSVVGSGGQVLTALALTVSGSAGLGLLATVAAVVTVFVTAVSVVTMMEAL